MDGRWAVGERIGMYRLVTRIGGGGAGEVWQARNYGEQRDVAIKRLVGRSAREPGAAERMWREAELAGRLDSPYIVPVYGTGEHGGCPYIVMRLVTGGDLAALVRSHRSGLGVLRAARIVGQLGRALDAAHARGLVHRDVKPANVLVEHTPGGVVVQLCDFGSAAAAGRRINDSFGTAAYMAPETSNGAPLTRAADIYGLGCILVELLTGRPPFSGPDTAAYRHQHEHEQPQLPGAVSASLIPFDPVVARALAKHPRERFDTAGDLAEAVSHAGAGAAPPREPSALLRRCGRWWRRRSRRGQILVAVALFAAVAGAAWEGVVAVTAPASPDDFRACVTAGGLPVSDAPERANSAGEGPDFTVGSGLTQVHVNYFSSDVAARSSAELEGRFLSVTGPAAGAEVVGRLVVVSRGPEADPRAVALVKSCL